MKQIYIAALDNDIRNVLRMNSAILSVNYVYFVEVLNMAKRELFFILIILATILNSEAQTLDSAVHEHHYNTFTKMDKVRSFDFDYIDEDTSLNFVHHIYSPRIKHAAWMDGGQIGTPGLNLLESGKWHEYFRMGPDYNSQYGYMADETKFYHGEHPRTSLKYGQGTGELIYLKAEHAQEVFKRWSFGIDYTRLKANNVYYGNLVDFTKIRVPNSYFTRLYTHHYSANRKYEVFSSLIRNTSTITESGGLSNTALFDTLEGRQKFYFNSAQLVGASNVFNNAHWRVEQFWRDGDRTITTADTSVKDTNASSIKSQWYHTMDLRWNRTNFIDETADESYYPHKYYSFETNDSNRVFSAKNRLGRSSIFGDSTGSLNYFAEYEFASAKQFPGHLLRTNIVRLGADLVRLKGKSKQSLSAKFVPVGYYAGDYWVNAKIEKNTAQSALKLKAMIFQSEQDFGTQFFASNHYYWYNSLKKRRTAKLMAKIRLNKPKLSLKLSAENVNGFVFFDSTGPRQSANDLNRVVVELKHETNLGRVFNLEQQILYQAYSNQEWRSPEFIYKGRFYAEGDLFDGNMLARLGLEAYYMSAFDGLTYNPVMRRFIWNDSRTSGGYPVIDVFLNAQVSAMQIFFHVQHASDGLFGYDFYAANNYPLQFRAFRLGLSWRMFN